VLHRKGRQENRHDPVLAERDAVIRMAGDLKDEVAVAPFVDELAGRQAPHGQTAEHERP
jgi:hypothetical protein